ncbi:Alginate biosynthesis protein AlgX [Ascidiaceihabitans donghaensis]|uniref:Alginate biosynthesis protein AlgX n=1 Tax=Ascidiaceihabitans donghaensis TaxID=1510460 RepID=A0A2R8BC21_9RHOB|nr:hypothetical protein [Ascidiaceihabitans donghaensis]SPH20613.1 Alginate biosynthesis protein AlgX [Ascidiaceihabitans donghaensis]
MKRLLTPLAFAAATLLASGGYATPYCESLAVKDQLPKKYQKRGPFYSDTSSGWIVGQDQLRNKYAVSDEAVALWHDIRAEFEKHAIDLVVLAAPPRPLFVPKSALDALGMPLDAELPVLQDGFSAYIAALNAAGIVAPDLSRVAQSPLAAEYYFARDTHWTPMGAAVSVAYLNAAMGKGAIDANLARITSTGTYDEKGSLAGVVKDACGKRPQTETVPAPQYAIQGSAASLLGAAPELEKLALVGTSFSDRYQRDAYQVADALAFMMDVHVDNFSVTGGGLVGSMEAFIRSGALASTSYKTVVWEAPYSAPLTDVNGLRQILGALKSAALVSHTEGLDARIGKDWISIEHSVSMEEVQGLEIVTEGTDTGQLLVEIIDGAGEKTRTKLVKSNRVAANLRSNRWALSLSGLPIGQIVRIKLRLPKSEKQEAATIHFIY